MEPIRSSPPAPEAGPLRPVDGRGPLAKHWVFTLNNPDGLLDPTLWPDCTYAVYQLEVGENGTEHFQGYVEFAKRIRMTALKKLSGLEGAHLDKRQGTPKQASEYAQKEDTRVEGPWVFGEISTGPGSRNDLLALQTDLDAGHDLATIGDNHFGSFLRYNRGIVTYRNLHQRPRDPTTHGDMEVHWIYGPSGTGKTYAAAQLVAPYTVCWAAQPKANGLRWTHYNYEQAVVLDDYHGSAMSWTDLMRFLNPYPLQLPTDGGAVEFNSKVIVFTSIEHPALIYQKHLNKIGRTWVELERRITTLTHLEEVHEEAFRGGRHPGPPPEAATIDRETIVVNGQVYIKHP